MTTDLKTWFEIATLEEAFALIQNGAVVRYLSYRQGAGTVWQDGGSALVMMPPNKTLRQGYTCRDSWCSRCKERRRQQQRCVHVAATVLLGLGRSAENPLLPFPLLFAQTPWFSLGHFLSSQAQRRVADISLEPEDSGWRLQLAIDNGFQGHVRLTENAGADLFTLFAPQFEPLPENFQPPALPSARIQKTIQKLFHSLVSRSRSANERDLHAVGIRSKGEKRDTSFWMELARLLGLAFPLAGLRVRRDQEGLFMLETAGSEDPLLRFTLPRDTCVDLLDGLDPVGLPVKRHPPATPFSKVDFTEDHSRLRVGHHVRLKDGRSLSLEELEGNRYGNHYYLEDYGFFSTLALKKDEKLEQAAEKSSQVTLFTAAARMRQPETGFIVDTGEIPAFLKANARALQSGVHQVDAAVLKLDIVSRPQRLQLQSYEEIGDWCYLAGYYDIGNQAIDLTELLQRGGAGEKYIAGKKWLQLEGTPLSWFHNLGQERIQHDDQGKTVGIRLRRHEMLALAGLLPEVAPPPKKKKMRERLSRLLDTDSWLEPDEEITLPAHLRSYQRHGVFWLYRLVEFHLGGILADDMGLGKTHQALTLLDLAVKKYPGSRYLVVCPTSVLLHWRDKAEKFFPELGVSLYYGAGRELASALESDIVATTYGVMRNDIQKLAQVHFRVVLFDEMQHLKNAATDTHKAALQLDADSLIGLTGTPIENALTELKALFDICLPGLFDNRTFRRFIKNDSDQTRRQLRNIVKPFILRRTRETVLAELPPVIEDIRLCELHEDQVGLYRQIIEEAEPQLDELLDGEQGGYMHILATITRLKQVCDHPCLLENCTDYQRYGSGKFSLWQELVQECLESGFKVVVFSHFTSMLDIMEEYLTDSGIEFCKIRGGMTPAQRQRSIKQLTEQDSCRLCLASLLAGGVGIDLTAAQVVIHYDRWWNPAKEEQATARLHRMGQQQTVQVIKLVSAGTLEEKIHALIEKKRALANDIIIEDDGSIMKNLSRDDIASLLKWQG